MCNKDSLPSEHKGKIKVGSKEPFWETVSKFDPRAHGPLLGTYQKYMCEICLTKWKSVHLRPSGQHE